MNSTLFKILNTQSVSYNQTDMQLLVIDLCERAGASVEVDQFGNVFATKGHLQEGQAYPCAVAHLDSVHDILPEDQYQVLEAGGKAFAINPLKMDFTGIGGDDKCGIYIAVQVLAHLNQAKAVFFVDEETGCEGSGSCSLDWFHDVGYLLQNDRRGSVDLARTICSLEVASLEFQGVIQHLVPKYGRAWCDNGGLTDVYKLATRGLNISALNIACSYYDPHTSHEYIDVRELEGTLRFNLEAIQALGLNSYPHEHKRAKYTPVYGGQYWGGFTPANWSTDAPTQEDAPKSCNKCGGLSMQEDAWGHYCTSCGAYTLEDVNSWEI